MFRQAIEGVELAIEEGTNRVPQDGKFYVIHQDQIVGSYRSLKKAQEKYRGIRDSLNLPAATAPSNEEQQAAALKAESDAVVDKMELETFANAKKRNTRRRHTRTFG